MALPAILRRLFKSSGYGPELNDDIVSKTISNQDWSNAYNYPVGAVVRGSNGVLYYSVAQSGPGTSAGAKNPVNAGASYWVSLDIASLESNINNALAGKVSTTDFNAALADKVSVGTYNSGLATRVALDGSNASSIGKTLSTYMARTALPSGQKIKLSLPAQYGTVTTPADGWMYIHGTAITTNAIRGSALRNNSNGLQSNCYVTYQGFSVDAYVPCLAGDAVWVDYYEQTGIALYFIYANGTKS